MFHPIIVISLHKKAPLMVLERWFVSMEWFSYSFFNILNAWFHSFFLNHGIHRRIQSDSIAPADFADHMSSTSNPHLSAMEPASCLASPSFPQMNMLGLSPSKSGLIICQLPIHEKHLTKRACGNWFWRRSINEKFIEVKNWITPSSGWTSSMGFVVSSITLPLRCSFFARESALSATEPLTAKMMTSPKAAVSSNVQIIPPNHVSSFRSTSFWGERVPRQTSYPSHLSPYANVFHTSHDHKTPILNNMVGKRIKTSYYMYTLSNCKVVPVFYFKKQLKILT